MSEKPPLALEYIRAIRDDRTLLPSEKLAAILMASHAGHDGDNAHPGIALLADEIGLKERQTKTIVANLVNKGWLIQTSSGRGNNRFASVYRLAIPQGATDCTLDASQGAMDCTSNVQPTARQGATHCPTNQPVEITKEIPVSQSVTDDCEEGSSTQDQELTGQDGPSADGEAGHGWEGCPSGETLVERLNEVLAANWPREDYPDAEPFDARFLRGGAKRLDELVRVANEHRFDMDDVVAGMFFTPHASWGLGHLGRADHNMDRVANPARLTGKAMSGPIDQFVAYGLRGREITTVWHADAA